MAVKIMTRNKPGNIVKMFINDEYFRHICFLHRSYNVILIEGTFY